MHSFWESSIKPILTGFKINKIIEIGAFKGTHTQKLLEHCKEIGGTLFVIDPEPLFDEDDWCKKYGSRLHVIKNLSLNVLPSLTGYDAVLIDGDHNWYTVYHELKLIERYGTNGNFPLIFLHDIEWPYGRRDMYYFPETIPAEFRKPYARKGIIRGQSELAEEGGLNPGLCNALFEGGERNGVLTAIEDFLSQTKIPIRFYKVSGHHGLGILAPADIFINKYLNTES